MIPFGSYFLVQRLTVGGMAEVFLAKRRDDPDGPLLVVKRILPHLQAKGDFVQMFLDEARLTSTLFHPNLVRVHDFGKAEDVHFIAMEYVDGLSLSLVLRRRPGRKLPLALGCWIVAEVCSGLAFAHEHADADGRPLGIVHRDVSPDNILISQRGEVKVADFGIAKAKIQLTRTRPGQIKGKFAYMSPEQGMRLQVDHRSDIFAAGLVLYEVTTGKRVFDAKSEVDILRALYARAYTPPHEVLPEYPPDLEAVVTRALAWDPDRRYASASELRAALLALIPESEDPATTVAELVRQMRAQMPIPKQVTAVDRSTRQQAAPLVVVPVASGRDTLLGVGETDPLTPVISEPVTAESPAPRDPSIASVLFPHAEFIGPAPDAGDDEEDTTQRLGGPLLTRDTEPGPPLAFGQDTEPMPVLDFEGEVVEAGVGGGPPGLRSLDGDELDTVRVPALDSEEDGEEEP